MVRYYRHDLISNWQSFLDQGSSLKFSCNLGPVRENIVDLFIVSFRFSIVPHYFDSVKKNKKKHIASFWLISSLSSMWAA